MDVTPLAALPALESDGVRPASVTGEGELFAELPDGHADMVARAVEWLGAVYRGEAGKVVGEGTGRSRRRSGLQGDETVNLPVF